MNTQPKEIKIPDYDTFKQTQIPRCYILSRQLPDSWNWIAILKDLNAGAPISNNSLRNLRVLAGSWPTCACGQLCKNIPRLSDGRPEDPVLRVLGTSFFHYIEECNWGKAIETFLKIEERTDLLLEISNDP
jgi:hypothetical protein